MSKTYHSIPEMLEAERLERARAAAPELVEALEGMLKGIEAGDVDMTKFRDACDLFKRIKGEA